MALKDNQSNKEKKTYHIYSNTAFRKVWKKFDKEDKGRGLRTCKSLTGFQPCSTKMTVSALVKFNPSPPTCVVSNRMSIEESLLNLSIH